MVDAWTQTDRSDFAIIKYKMQKKMQAKSLEKNKLNAMLNSQGNMDGSHSAIRTSNLGSHDILSSKIASNTKTNLISSTKSNNIPLFDSGIKAYSQGPLKIGIKSDSKKESSQSSAKSQLTPGFSRNPTKVPSKKTMINSAKKQSKLGKMRLPSIQGSRDKKTRD